MSPSLGRRLPPSRFAYLSLASQSASPFCLCPRALSRLAFSPAAVRYIAQTRYQKYEYSLQRGGLQITAAKASISIPPGMSRELTP